MKRTPLKQRAESITTNVLPRLPLAKRSKTSKKGRIAEGRPEFVAEVIRRANGRCQAMLLLRRVDHLAALNCLRIASEAHEPLTRARGGPTDQFWAVVSICRRCHEWCHQNEKLALQVGLMVHSWEGIEGAKKAFELRQMIAQII